MSYFGVARHVPHATDGARRARRARIDPHAHPRSVREGAVVKAWSCGRFVASVVAGAVLAACSAAQVEKTYVPPSLEAGVDATAPAADAGDARPDAGPAHIPDAGTWSDARAVHVCPVRYRWTPRAGENPRRVALAGSFNAFALPGQALERFPGEVAFTTTLNLAPGSYAYKVVVDGDWRLDEGEGRRIYEAGVENSMLVVADCNYPSVEVVVTHTARAGRNQGRFSATFRAIKAETGAPVQELRVVDRHDFGASAPVTVPVDPATGEARIELGPLADGRHSLDVTVADALGRRSAVRHLVTWIEETPFAWRDGVIYMAMIDRFADGDSAGNPTPIAGVDPRADFQGGDLWGLRDQVRAGTLDRLGGRAVWLSPFHRNPAGAYLASNGSTRVSGYHGYWPVKAREVDPRIGGEAALRAFVKEAHAHGIRVLQDFVVNHVHQEHEYVQSHPDWFRTGCVCGTPGCDWTGRRIDCLFAPYLPDVNWSVPAAAEQFVEDASFWLDSFELDGLRVDAVKHVEDAAAQNLAAMVRSRFEGAGTRMFLTGETAMGWSECTPPQCPGNEENYGTIRRYLGPHGLDGQFDFVLFHAVTGSVFAYEDRGLAHLDYWTRASLATYQQDAIMTPYVGSHDTTRFATMATYRGQPGFPRGDAFRQWDAAPTAPADAAAHARHRLAFSWLLTIPGAPLIYYGDEYGETGASDPNNRVAWRGAGALSSDERTTRTHLEKLGQARAELAPLRHGDYKMIVSSDDFLVFSRTTSAGEAAVVLLARTAGARHVALPPALASQIRTPLRDRLTGAVVPLVGSALDVNLPAHGAMVLAP